MHCGSNRRLAHPVLPALLFLLLAFRAFADGENAKGQSNDFISVVTANFCAWDTDHDGTLSKQELAAAIKNPENKGAMAAALAALKRGRVPGELTTANLRHLPDKDKARLLSLYKQFLKRINGATNRDLYPSGAPQLTTIHQGRMGNCYCLAPLGAMLNRDPQDIANLFSVQPGGNVLVRFAGGPVLVTPPTDAELALTAGNSHDGVWINLYEKAMGQARNERMPTNKRASLDIDAIATGGSPEPILSYLTGHKVGGFSIQFAQSPDAAAKLEHLRQQLADATAQRRLMTCGTGEVTTPGLSPHHIYAVLEYDHNSDSVKLWNPHGNNFTPDGPPCLTNGYPTTNGIFRVPLADLPHQFTHVSIERAEPAPLQWLDEWEILAQAGHFEEAAVDLSEVIDLDPSALAQYHLTPLLIQTGRIDQYRERCKQMLNKYEKTGQPSIAEQVAKSCLLLPNAVGPEDLTRAANLAARAVTISKDGDWMHWRLMTRGLAELRAGKYQTAIETEQQSRQQETLRNDLNGYACEADTYFISAIAHYNLSQSAEFRTDLNHALKIVQKKLPKLDSGDLGLRWFDTLMANILMREAQAMRQ